MKKIKVERGEPRFMTKEDLEEIAQANFFQHKSDRNLATAKKHEDIVRKGLAHLRTLGFSTAALEKRGEQKPLF